MQPARTFGLHFAATAAIIFFAHALEYVLLSTCGHKSTIAIPHLHSTMRCTTAVARELPFQSCP